MPKPLQIINPIDPESELKFLEEYKKMLEEEVRDLQEELKGVESRIAELKRMLGKT